MPLLFRTDKNVASNKNRQQFVTMFTHYYLNVKQGDIVNIKDVLYLAYKDNSNENQVYNKTYLIEINQEFDFMLKDNFGGANLTHFLANGYDLTSSLDSIGGTFTVGSRCRFTLPQDEVTERIRINGRFFTGFPELVWKIIDINWQDGLVELYCERDNTSTTDDIKNKIADRWLYEQRPDTYNVTIKNPDISVQIGGKIKPIIKVTKNEIEYTPTKPFNFVISDTSIIDIDNTTNEITGLKVGNTNVYVTYKEKGNDILIGDNMTVNVIAVPPNNYVVTSNLNDITLELGKDRDVVIAVTKNGESYTPTQEIEWTNTDPSVAILENTTIKSKGVGNTTLTGIYKEKDTDNCVPAVIDVLVEEKPKDIYRTDITTTLNKLEVGKTALIQYKVYKNDVEIIPTPSVTFDIDNASVLSINTNNVVTALSVGDATITAKYRTSGDNVYVDDTLAINVVKPMVRYLTYYSQIPYNWGSGTSTYVMIPFLNSSAKISTTYAEGNVPKAFTLAQNENYKYVEVDKNANDNTIKFDKTPTTMFLGENCYELGEGLGAKLITITHEGVNNPNFVITLSVDNKSINLSGNSDYVKYTINNSNGTINIENIQALDTNIIRLDVLDKATMTYNTLNIKLAPAF